MDAQNPLAETASYLAPHGDAFWRWSSDLEALEWSDGVAIAFYEEVQAVLQAVPPYELPPFQAIVILLAACQYNWKETSRFEVLVGYTQILDRDTLEKRLPDDWQRLLLSNLDRIHDIVSDRHCSAKAFKCAIAERLHESRGSIAGADWTRRILEQLEMGIPALVLSAKGDPGSVAAQTGDFIVAIYWLLGGNWPSDAESIDTRVATGLSQVPAAANLPDDPELPDVARLRLLLNHLANSEDELSGIARVAQKLMAAVHLPRAIAEPEELPLGGYSDISNRGALDRLLITELAHDDETLSARVALNEALYLRRESPPKTPQRRRVLLIDCGIRLWGVPRVFATAVGLALAATAEKLARVSAFRTAGSRFVPSDFRTRDGLVAHLAALDPSPHPAAAAAELLERVAADPDDAELVLVTHPEVLTDPEFRRELRGRLGEEPVYIATVDGGGRYELIVFSRLGEKRLQQACIDLDELLRSPDDTPSPTRELLRDDIDPDLPSIFSLRLFPLRLPAEYDPRRSVYHPEVGVVGHTRDGRLLFWDRERTGARLISSEVPKGSVVWHHLEAEARTAHVLVFAAGHVLFSTHLDTGESHTRRLEVAVGTGIRNRRAYSHHRQSLFVVTHDVAQMFSLHDGRPCGSIGLPQPLSNHCGRFFRFGNNAWFALSGDSLPHLELIHKGNPHLLQIFDTTEQTAPVGYTASGSLILLDGNENPELMRVENGREKLPVYVSDDTKCIAVETGGRTTYCDLTTREVLCRPELARLNDALLNPRRYALAGKSKTPHIHFRAIGCTGRGRLFLVSAKGAIHSIEYHGGIILRHLANSPPPAEPISFEEIPAPGGARFKLLRARWPCGTCAYLDTRGFLHIDPTSNDTPEITFTLRDGLLSGWCSDGRFFGEDYFIHPEHASDSREVFRNLEKITARILAFADLP